ncbi:ATP-dependent Clp protease ATP-binding subunit [Bacillus sp. FJAT-45350]|uniref:ATP-dependent Clp protease ATP-binding subunit n=1 Tax=Bacillus sp. FJAT-45350 TaxID=2011014 RepID=UPI000BB86478|nr:ATP-dependent Clp protease ATP-binding subunit [Bacillus sp. FJAT-45350]
MKCQQCQMNEANVMLYYEVNGKRSDFRVCSDCYSNHFVNSNQSSNVFGSNQGSFSTGICEVSGTDDKQKGVLETYGRDVTEIARTGLIDPVIGRDDEVEQIAEILNRRNKNNPVLIGEPGVGKTAIAEGLALKIVEGTVPEKLRNKRVISLDVASLLSGTSYRGQFEERMKQLLDELEANKDIILFIDEIHQLVGAGKTEGSMDAGNVLKPALARGEVQVVGATTLNEYREIEKDAALERRFQPIQVREPSVKDTIAILKGIAPKYEAYHTVKYSDEVLEACAELSHRYIQDRHLPDKAIDLLDMAGAKRNLKSSVNDKTTIEKRLEEILREKQVAAEKEDYETAARLRQEELQLEEKVSSAKNIINEITVEDIEKIIEKKTGISVTKLQQAEQEKLKNLSDLLSAKVIGQDEAVQAVSKAIRRNRAGFRQQERPIASFLFVGQTGVGKTELTKVLAEELFGDRHALIRLDMSEYMEKHTVSKLIGSPPGYDGHEEAGQLTEQVRRKPYSIILLDEMEKAHPDVQNMFLQVLEDGRLTDSKGRAVSFKDSIIVMTSNATTLDTYFKPEFLNRIDSVVKFNKLEREHLLSILENMLQELLVQAQKQGVSIDMKDEVKEKLVEYGYDEKFGARPLRRAIQDHLEDKLVDVILDNESVQNITVEVIDGEIQVTPNKKI